MRTHSLPQLRCISVLRHLAGGGRRTGSLADEARAYFTSHFGNWTWCERKEAWRRLPGLVMRNTSLCAPPPPTHPNIPLPPPPPTPHTRPRQP